MSLLAERKKAGKTQAETAKCLGVSVAAVSLWENKVTSPRTNLLPKIASFYGCTVDELLREDSNGTDHNG